MKVSELIVELQKLNPDLPVYGLETDNSCCSGCEVEYCGSGVGSDYAEITSVYETVETPHWGKPDVIKVVSISVY